MALGYQPTLLSLLRLAFARNPLRLNRRGPLNRRKEHTTKNAILLKLGGTIRKV